jgi:uncharacterized membrane protein YjjP (DUF1212 family)
MMVKQAVGASLLLSIAVTLLTLGVSQVQAGNLGAGLLLILVGFGLICVTVYAAEKHIIPEAVKRAVREEAK